MKKLFNLPEGRYDPTFLKALACAIHTEVLEPSELDFWFEDGREMIWMAKEMYSRLKPKQKRQKKYAEENN